MAGKSGTSVTIIDKGYDKTIREIRKLKKSYTAVGWFGRGGTPENDVAARALVLERGATIRVTKKMRGYLAGQLGIFLKKTTNIIRIPARPFIAKTFSLYHRKVRGMMALELDKIIAGKSTAKASLSRIGEWYTGRIKYVMSTVRFAPNHPATIAKKKSSKPLMDTGALRNSTTHREFMKK